MYKWIGHIALVSFNSNMGDLTNFVLSPNKYVSPHSYSSHSLLVVVVYAFNGTPLIVYLFIYF